MSRNGESGQAIVAVALGLVVLLGMLGLGIDFGYLRYMKRQMQTAADAAAIAGSGISARPAGDQVRCRRRSSS